LAAYNEATANASRAPQIVIEPPTIGSQSDVPKTGVNQDLNHYDENDTALTVGMFK
jgi:hypothetical protein